jgi:hypothetical protein
MSRPIQSVVGATLALVGGWLAWINLSKPTWDGWIFWLPITFWLLSMSVLCWWSALTSDRDTKGRIEASWRLGWTVGAIGLFAGFVGPLLLSDSNLGPLLGILITGPLGFVAGALAAGAFGAIGQEPPGLNIPQHATSSSPMARRDPAKQSAPS